MQAPVSVPEPQGDIAKIIGEAVKAANAVFEKKLLNVMDEVDAIKRLLKGDADQDCNRRASSVDRQRKHLKLR